MRRLPKTLRWILLVICVLLMYNGVLHIICMKDNYMRKIKHVKYRLYEDSFVPEDFYWLFNDTLELRQINDKCGEWGGDIETIKVFHKSQKLFGYYTREIYNCDSLSWVGYENPIISRTKDIEFTQKQTNLLKKAILDLTENKLKNVLPLEHYGINNTVEIMGKDESLKIFLYDYPSFKWNKFHKLKDNLLKQDN